ncbi:MAG: RAMP superfamily CRISPR-associated protein [Acidobacteriota bacterium]|nr:RAMP superfamily CRISPR-associated protein [Acidobacteriota bacterium]
MPDRPQRGSWQQQEPEPKPFGKVVLPKHGARRNLKAEDRPHDRFKRDTDTDKYYTGKLDCYLRALTPIHVGSGIYELVKDDPVRGLITADGKVIVPGTSLKGAVRSIAEAISDSCLRIARDEIKRNLSNDVRPCDEVKSSHRQSGQEKNRDPKLCPCCSIFGALGYQGRVSFTDARLIDGKGSTAIHHIQSPYPPRESARFYKDFQRRFNGRKFYFHGEPVAAQRGEPYQVITEDSELAFTLQFESLTAKEFCLLLVAMGVLDDVVIKIGGGKQAMLGSTEIHLTRLELQDPEKSFTEFAAGVHVIQEKITGFLLDEVGSHNTLINEGALDELLKIWEYPTERKSPIGMY